MSSSLSKKIITYDAVERYHDNLEEQLNNEYLRKDELIQSDWACDGNTSNEYIKNRTHYSVVFDTLAELNIQDGWNTGDVLCSVDAYYFEDEYYGNKCFVQITNNTGNFTEPSQISVPKNGATIELPLNGPSMSATWRRVVNDPADPQSDIYELVLENKYNVYIDNALTFNLMEAHKQLSEPYIPVSIARVANINDMLPIEKGTGENSIVQKGSNNIASGIFSVALGKATQAKGRASHTEGWYTIANNESEHASGKFNLSTESSDKSQATQFSIGIGTSDTNRKNAFEVKQNGDIYVDGVEGRIQDRLNIDLLVPIEHSDLKKLRDSNQLIPGQKYRITDYITTTTQENTTSALHPFDVIVTALDNHTLSENASAVKSGRDDDLYFETENVEAWQLKYCLDNDTGRFAWADNNTVQWYSRIVANYIVDQSGTHAYSLDKDAYIYDFGTMPHPDTGEDTLVFYTQNPIYFEEAGADYGDIYFYNGITTVDGVEYDSWRKFDGQGVYWVNSESDGEGVYALTKRVVYNGSFIWPDNTGVENGKGVIYNMIDEYGNECPYDFKNIKFYHDGLGTSVYTFTWIDEEYNVMDTSVFGNNGTLTYYGEIRGVYGNIIKPYHNQGEDEAFEVKQALNNITFISDYGFLNIGNAGFYGCYNNSFGNNCYNNSFGNNCQNNPFGNGCYSNSFGNGCYSNSFGNGCYSNSFGNDCYSNSFGNDCQNNPFGNGCYSNSFGNDCCYNKFGSSCYNNSFGNDCQNNPFGNGCYSNSFENGCNYNEFGNSCYNNSFGNDCNYNEFGSSCYNNSFGNGCNYNEFGNNCSSNSFGNSCWQNYFGQSALNIFPLLKYCCCNHFDDGCSYNVILNSTQPTSSNKLQNIHVVRGVRGTASAYNFINVVDKNAAYEIKVAKNSSGEIKIYCEADLIA